MTLTRAETVTGTTAVSDQDLRRMIQNLANSRLISAAERRVLNDYLRTGRSFITDTDGRIQYA
jgi:hypothetical protein